MYETYNVNMTHITWLLYNVKCLMESGQVTNWGPKWVIGVSNEPFKSQMTCIAIEWQLHKSQMRHLWQYTTTPWHPGAWETFTCVIYGVMQVHMVVYKQCGYTWRDGLWMMIYNKNACVIYNTIQSTIHIWHNWCCIVSYMTQHIGYYISSLVLLNCVIYNVLQLHKAYIYIQNTYIRGHASPFQSYIASCMSGRVYYIIFFLKMLYMTIEKIYGSTIFELCQIWQHSGNMSYTTNGD